MSAKAYEAISGLRPYKVVSTGGSPMQVHVTEHYRTANGREVVREWGMGGESCRFAKKARGRP